MAALLSRHSFWGAAISNWESTRHQLVRHANAVARILAFTFLPLAAISYFAGPDWRDKWGLLAVILAVHWTLIFYFIWLWLTAPRGTYLAVPDVVAFLRQRELLLVKSSPWLSVGVLVSVYRRNGDFDELIASGEVETVREDGRSQVKIFENDFSPSGEENLLDILEKTKMDKVIIRPGLARGYL
jgi:hypothetical protein